MTDVVKKPDSWGKPPDRAKEKKRELRFNLLNNFMTFILAAVIIAGGFMFPTLVYPYLDFYHNDIIQLVDPSEYYPDEYIFENPIILYPWNLYEEQLLRALSISERDFLRNKGIAPFLLATMCDRGLEKDKEDADYLSFIINSFYYLEPRDSNDPGCYILVDLDIDGDATPDLRCAVDNEGTIISWRVLSEAWDTVLVESPIGLSVPEVEEGQEGEGTVSSEDGKNPEMEDKDPNATDPLEDEGATEEEGEEEADETPDVEEDEAQEGDDETEQKPPENNPAIEHPPLREDQIIWSFAYSISRQALLIDQQRLFRAFRQLELHYEVRYDYAYTLLLPIQSPEEEILPEVAYTLLTPLVIRSSDQYLLYVYNLPTGEQLILYLEPINLKCMGYNLLTLSP